MFDDKLNAIHFAGVWQLNHPETGAPWANAAEAYAWAAEQSALLGAPMQDKPAPLVVPVTNIHVAGPTVEQIGKIYWVKAGQPVTITADVSLPDARHMIMLDEMVDATVRMPGVREPATIANGRFTLNLTFPRPGNFLLEADRLSRGFQRIGQNIQLQFPLVEFDVYGGV